jgi:uridine kinase
MNAISPPPFVIGVAGGSGSGKSTVSRQVSASFGADMVSVVMQDDYYRDQSDLAPRSAASRITTIRRHSTGHCWYGSITTKVASVIGQWKRP